MQSFIHSFIHSFIVYIGWNVSDKRQVLCG